MKCVFRLIILSVVILQLSLLITCSMMDAGGNSSETGSVVCVASSDRALKIKTEIPITVYIYSVSYIPFVPVDFSGYFNVDGGEVYVIDSLPEMFCNVLIKDVVSGGNLFIDSVPLFTNSVFEQNYDSIPQPGTISGTVKDTITDSPIKGVYVCVLGSPFWDYTGDLGQFTMADVPNGLYKINFFADPLTAKPVNPPKLANVDTSKTITVLPGDTTFWE